MSETIYLTPYQEFLVPQINSDGSLCKCYARRILGQTKWAPMARAIITITIQDTNEYISPDIGRAYSNLDDAKAQLDAAYNFMSKCIFLTKKQVEKLEILI